MNEQEDFAENSIDSDATGHDIDVSSGAPFRANDDVPLGELFASRYRVQESLGHGGFGSVYKAEDISLKRTVAIKVLRYSGSDREIQRFHQEGKAIAQLDHPNIIRVFEFGVTDDERPYLVMDYLKGQTLTEEIKKGRLTLERSLEVLRQACDAIECAHLKGIVHRDIKPSNLMIVKNEAGVETIKLLDFGLAKLRDETGDTIEQLTRTGEMFGTPQYMSLEQIHCEPTDERSDIYSLGCVFYEMVAGVPPFRGQNAIETCLLHKKADPVPIWKVADDIPQAERVHGVILKMLAKSPRARFQNISELRSALKDIDKSDSQISRHWRRFLLSFTNNRIRLRYLTAVAGMVVISLVVLIAWGFVTVTDGVDLKHLGPDVLTSSWKHFDYQGQQAFDKGDYDFARTQFDKALVKARIDFSNKRKKRLWISLYEISTLCDVAGTPKPLCAQTLQEPGIKSFEQADRFNTKNLALERPTLESVKDLILILSDLVALRGYTSQHNLPEMLKATRAQLNQLKPVPELERLKLDIIEMQNEVELTGISIARRAQLANCLSRMDELALKDRHLASDWRWCCISTEAALSCPQLLDLANRIDRLETAARLCRFPTGKLRCNLLKSLLIMHYEGEIPGRTSMEKTLREFEKSEERPDFGTAYLCSALATMYSRAKLPERSLPLMRRAQRLMYGTPMKASLEYESQLLMIYCDLDRLDDALKVGNHALEVLKRSTNPASVEVGRAMLSLAYVHLKRGEYDKAEMYLLNALANFAKHPDHHNVPMLCLQAMENLVSLYMKTGDAQKANLWAERIVALKKQAAEAVEVYERMRSE